MSRAGRVRSDNAISAGDGAPVILGRQPTPVAKTIQESISAVHDVEIVEISAVARNDTAPVVKKPLFVTSDKVQANVYQPLDLIRPDAQWPPTVTFHEEPNAAGIAEKLPEQSEVGILSISVTSDDGTDRHSVDRK
ncbi:MAG: hypothetical protein AAF404_14200 [Pseudomonadota bacterium]